MKAVVLGMVAIVFMAFAAEAQPRPSVRGFADVGLTTFSAGESFDAVLGSARGMVFGGGAEVVLPQRMFVGFRASRFRSTGERVFVLDGERFSLGIPTTITVTPIELTGGYRFALRQSRIVPFVGGGVGWHRLEETSEFSSAQEDLSAWPIGYHVLGGAEGRLARRVGIAGEAEWSIVPHGLGQDPNSVSALFDEHDLGGFTFRLKIIVGNW